MNGKRFGGGCIVCARKRGGVRSVYSTNNIPCTRPH